jgi:DNA polymerase-4
MTTTSRWILHADMDAFYASVEQRDDPTLRGKPVIIGATQTRGVVSAASYEARTFGVRSAMPGFEAKKRCPDGIFLPGDMKKYAAVSRQIHAIFRDFTDQIEPLALDEAFLDISGSLKLFGEALDVGRMIKARVRDELDLVVSVGIAPNKLVAKIACSQGKPDGLLLVGADDIRSLLDPLPVRALWGVGPKAEARLKQLHVHTLRQLVTAPDETLRRAFGEHADAMRQRAQGIDHRKVESVRVAKSIGEEATFPENVSDEARISAAITAHSEKVAQRARRTQQLGLTVVLKVKLARRKSWGTQLVSNHELFPLLSRQIRLKSATADGQEIRSAALELWRTLNMKEPVRLLGVTLTDLRPATDPRQLDLFALPAKSHAKSKQLAPERAGTTRGEALGKTLDAISDKYGDGAIGRAAASLEKITHSTKFKAGDD